MQIWLLSPHPANVAIDRIVNDLIKDSLTFGTRHKLRIERQ